MSWQPPGAEPPPPPPPPPGTPPAWPGAPPPPAPGYGYSTQKTNVLAIISLVAGCAQFVFCVPATIAAVVTGHVARRQIRQSNGAEGGTGLATAGLVLGYIGLGLMVLGVVAVAVLLVFIDDIEEASLRDDAREFVREAESIAERQGSDSLRDPDILEQAYEEQLAGYVDSDAYLPTGVSILAADISDWERARWRIELRGEGLGDVYVCLVVPEFVGAPIEVSDGRCAL